MSFEGTKSRRIAHISVPRGNDRGPEYCLAEVGTCWPTHVCEIRELNTHDRVPRCLQALPGRHASPSSDFESGDPQPSRRRCWSARSGSGKTTLLRMINRMVDPTARRDRDRRREHPRPRPGEAAPLDRLRDAELRPAPALQGHRQRGDRSGAQWCSAARGARARPSSCSTSGRTFPRAGRPVPEPALRRPAAARGCGARVGR